MTNVPLNNPIAWRESTKGSRIWLVFLFLLEIPALFLIIWLARTGNGDETAISLEIFGLWAVSALLICVHTASLITRERNQQTLDLLLTTPLTSAEIVQQKFDGISNLMIICAIPLFSCILFHAWWRPQGEGLIWWEYLITSLGCIVIYFQIIGWIALWAGLRNKSPTRATLEALGGLLCFCCVPQFFLMLPVLILLPVQMVTGIKFMELLLAQITPLGMIGLMEFINLRTLSEIPLLPALTNTAYYGTLLWWVRGYVLRRADVLLGRTVHY